MFLHKKRFFVIFVRVPRSGKNWHGLYISGKRTYITRTTMQDIRANFIPVAPMNRQHTNFVICVIVVGITHALIMIK